MKPFKLPLAEVTWLDAQHEHGTSIKDAIDLTPILSKSVGYVQQNDTAVVLTQTVCEDGDVVSEHIVIPLSMVIQVTELEREGT